MGISVIYRMRTKCEAPFLILNYFGSFVLSDLHCVNIFVNFLTYQDIFFIIF